MAPRTTNAPWSGVQKITGLSAAENVAIRLAGPIPPSDSLAIGKPRSLPTGPPSDSYFARMSLSTAFAPVAGLKNTLPPAKSWAIPSPPMGYWPPCLAPSGPFGAAGRAPGHVDGRGGIDRYLQALELVGQCRGVRW